MLKANKSGYQCRQQTEPTICDGIKFLVKHFQDLPDGELLGLYEFASATLRKICFRPSFSIQKKDPVQLSRPLELTAPM